MPFTFRWTLFSTVSTMLRLLQWSNQDSDLAFCRSLRCKNFRVGWFVIRLMEIFIGRFVWFRTLRANRPRQPKYLSKKFRHILISVTEKASLNEGGRAKLTLGFKCSAWLIRCEAWKRKSVLRHRRRICLTENENTNKRESDQTNLAVCRSVAYRQPFSTALQLVWYDYRRTNAWSWRIGSGWLDRQHSVFDYRFCARAYRRIVNLDCTIFRSRRLPKSSPKFRDEHRDYCHRNRAVDDFSLTFVGKILDLMQTPAEIKNDAQTFISVIFASMVVLMAYNLLSNIIRALGDSKTPLYFWFCNYCQCYFGTVVSFGISLGIAGAGFATVLAQGVSVVLCIVYIVRKLPLLQIEWKDFKTITKNRLASIFTLDFRWHFRCRSLQSVRCCSSRL